MDWSNTSWATLGTGSEDDEDMCQFNSFGCIFVRSLYDAIWFQILLRSQPLIDRMEILGPLGNLQLQCIGVPHVWLVFSMFKKNNKNDFIRVKQLLLLLFELSIAQSITCWTTAGHHLESKSQDKTFWNSKLDHHHRAVHFFSSSHFSFFSFFVPVV